VKATYLMTVAATEETMSSAPSGVRFLALYELAKNAELILRTTDFSVPETLSELVEIAEREGYCRGILSELNSRLAAYYAYTDSGLALSFRQGLGE